YLTPLPTLHPTRFLISPTPPRSTLFPYTTLFRSHVEFMPLKEHPYGPSWGYQVSAYYAPSARYGTPDDLRFLIEDHQAYRSGPRSEEHTSELQSPCNLVCRLLLEKKKRETRNWGH